MGAINVKTNLRKKKTKMKAHTKGKITQPARLYVSIIKSCKLNFKFLYRITIEKRVISNSSCNNRLPRLQKDCLNLIACIT